MRDFKKECIEETDNALIKFEEKKKVLIFKNNKRQTLIKVQVYGCEITKGLRCDNLLVNKHTGDEFFVELKGVDVGHALEQLDQTMKQLSDQKCKGKKVNAYIVCTNISPKISFKRQAFIKKCKKIYGSSFDLIVKERRCSVNL